MRVGAVRPVLTSQASAVVVALVAMAGCGGDDPGPTRVVEVTTNSNRFCTAINDRRALAKDPPRLEGYQLRNQDLDNFSGTSEAACNQRQLVYWGPLAGGSEDRLAVTATLQFFPTAGGAQRAASMLPRDRPIELGSSSTTTAFRTDNGEKGYFVPGKAFVLVAVGCADPAGSVRLVNCQSAPAGSLRSELTRTLKSLEQSIRNQFR